MARSPFCNRRVVLPGRTQGTPFVLFVSCVVQENDFRIGASGSR